MAVEDAAQPHAEQAHEELHDGAHFPIVGIGASAGGLEAFTELLQNLPSEPGLALLFVLHLEPRHKSQLPEIISKMTEMPVHEVKEGMTVQLNNVYLIPPNTNMALTDGHLSLSPRSVVPGQHMPIDHLFRSLATINHNRAMGVLLSGGGTDGTLGFQAIKGEGGITFAQEEKSARQVSMPRSAIVSGLVDYVLTPDGIAHKLTELARHPYAAPPAAAPPMPAGETIVQMLSVLRSATGVDFTHYKHSTIRRRILRRMALLGIHDARDYLEHLGRDRTEVHNLYQDFLIRVTQFFRDPEAFDFLRDHVFPALIEGRKPESTIRVWVAGCATGEEAYSVVIALLEFLDSRGVSFPIKILATDLNEAALDKARAGVYVDNIEIDVSSERLRRFFVRVNGNYQVSKAVRELCIFSRHHLGSDPPFSHLDLVCCRNVLIYMDTNLQRRTVPIFYYSLNPGGFLFLGSSESIGPFNDLFSVADPKQRIFTKRAGVAATPPDFSARILPELRSRPGGREEGTPLWTALDVQKEADRIVLMRYAPVGAVVDEAANVLQFRGRTSPYLEPAPGLATLDLFRMLREGLLAEVRAAFNQAQAQNSTIVRDNLRVTDHGQERQLRVEVIPFTVPPSGMRFFLVLFQGTSGDTAVLAPATPETRVAETDQVAQLQQDLAALREYLQSVIEEQESTNEELKSANEEILSANEELQSTNEELQTAKEEAQSANEELATVNEELRHRNTELSRVNNDLVNLLSATSILIVMVSRELRIRRFTPLAERLFNLIPTDIGRPISDIKPNLEVDNLSRLIADAIETLAPYEAEVRDHEGRWYLMRIRPYVTVDGKIDGASVVLLDIDALKRRPADAGPAPEANPG